MIAARAGALITMNTTTEARERLQTILPCTQSFGLVPAGDGFLLALYHQHGKSRSFEGDVVDIEIALERAGISKRCRCGELIARDMSQCAECEKCPECGREDDHASDCPLRPSVSELRDDWLANRYS